MRQLEPVTEAGTRFVEACEAVVPAVQEHAARHDRDGTFAIEGLQALKDAGITAATVPVEHGGWGLSSTHDLAVGLSRLAAGDPALAIAVNMHHSCGWNVTKAFEGELAKGRDGAGPALLLNMLGQGSIALVNATEPGTDNRHPYTEVVRTDDGWSLSGTKIFSTLSPVTDVFLVTARASYPEGGDNPWQMGFAVTFAGSPGITVNDDWDAMGMRASGSGSVTYEEVRLPAELFLAGGPWGEYTSGGLVGVYSGNIGLVAVFAGIAETAYRLAVQAAQRVARKNVGTAHAGSAGVRHLVGEMEAGVLTAQAVVARAALELDDLVDGRVLADIPLEDVHRAHARFQAAKQVVQRTAQTVVDQAMTVAGGSSYLSGNQLSRLYRDVRAGSFMQPFSPVEAWGYIGGVALGDVRDPFG